MAETTNPDRELLTEAARCADQLDALADILADEGQIIVDSKGDRRPHPAMAEQARAQQQLARLLTALRMPDQTTGQVPQRRGVRGSYAPRSAAGAPVSSLADRLKRASGGVS